MAWIESHQELGRHPKTKKLARILGVSIPAAVGHLQFFWWWALDYAQDGTLDRYEAGDIADAALWDGNPNALLSALHESGFLDLTNEGYAIHDWREYAGRLLDKRRQNTERKRKSRGSHAAVTQDMRGSHGATQPYTTEPNRTVPKDKDIPAPDAAGVCDPAPAENCNEQGAQQKSTKTAGKGEDYTPEFEKFWSVYPRRLEKLRAYKAWRTRRKENVTPDDMILAAENYAAHCAASGAEPRFIKHSATFLGPDKPFLDWIKPGKEEQPKARAPDDYEDLSLRWRDDRGG